MIHSDKRMQIIRAEEGVIVAERYVEEHNSGGNPILAENVEVVSTGDEREDVKRVCELVAVYLGFPYDKFGYENINISFDRKGSKVE